ncbi:carbohydrate ABC transporter permease [Agrobacterium sp. NPDC089420]|uniref:carbohydrate ABC transporter permease n=1 Tax=Agrobacterium sp. NPDC089420 TaxID=3363918 RepID=UPI00384EF622
MASKFTTSNRAGWFMAGPVAALLAVFTVLPFFMAVGFSFTDQRLISPNAPRFVGLANYQQLLGVGVLTLQPNRDANGSVQLNDKGERTYPALRTFTRGNPEYQYLSGMREWFTLDFGQTRFVALARDVVFMKAMGNTLIFVLLAAPLQSMLALVLALLINQRLPGITVFRAIYFMPVVVSIVVVSMLWQFIYAADNGLLNNMLKWLSFGGFQSVNWLGNPSTALGSIIGMSIWQGVGFHMVIWLSGLQTINPVLYEAAAIEGANRRQVFRFVTWPGLRNTAVLILIVITMQAFAVFSQINVMTAGGPLDSTQTIMFQAVERGFARQDIASGAAISVIFFAMVVCVSLTQRYLTRQKV